VNTYNKQIIDQMYDKAKEVNKLREFNEEAARIQYEDLSMSRIEAMRRALKTILNNND
jgi:hypothetical protein